MNNINFSGLRVSPNGNQEPSRTEHKESGLEARIQSFIEGHGIFAKCRFLQMENNPNREQPTPFKSSWDDNEKLFTLAGVPFHLISEKLSNFTQLEKLGCFNLPDTELSEEDLQALENVQELTFKYIGLKSFPKGLENCKNLKRLILTGNNLENLPEDLLKNNLEYVSLNENPIKTIPKIYTDSKLKELDVSSCRKLKEIPDWIKNAKNLHTLKFFCSEIKTVSSEVKSLENLTTVKAADTPFLLNLGDEKNTPEGSFDDEEKRYRLIQNSSEFLEFFPRTAEEKKR